jgi:hypothetical protein
MQAPDYPARQQHNFEGVLQCDSKKNIHAGSFICRDRPEYEPRLESPPNLSTTK